MSYDNESEAATRSPAPGTVTRVTMMRRAACVAVFDGAFWRSVDARGPIKCVPSAITSIETPYIYSPEGDSITPARDAGEMAARLAREVADRPQELAEVAADEREALTKVLRTEYAADLVLDSDWLRDHDAALTAKAKAEALREAGAKVANMRNGATGRRVTNAEYLGEVVYAMGDEITYQAERADRMTP